MAGTYEGTTIGLPFILLNPETGLGISNNRIKAHHLGALFTFNKLDITLKLSAVNDAGSPSNPLTTAIDYLYTFGAGVYHTNYGDFFASSGSRYKFNFRHIRGCWDRISI